MKNPDSLWWASSDDIWYLVAKEALDCGERETTTTLCLSASPVCMCFKENTFSVRSDTNICYFFKNSIQTGYLSFWQGVSNDKSLLENYINKEHSHKHAYRYAMEFSPLVRYICVIHVFICLYFAELNRAFAELMLYSRGWHFYLWVPFTQ